MTNELEIITQKNSIKRSKNNEIQIKILWNEINFSHSKGQETKSLEVKNTMNLGISGVSTTSLTTELNVTGRF